MEQQMNEARREEWKVVTGKEQQGDAESKVKARPTRRSTTMEQQERELSETAMKREGMREGQREGSAKAEENSETDKEERRQQGVEREEKK